MGGPASDMDPITLRFRDADAEARFRAQAIDEHLGAIRLSMLIGAAIFCAFGWLDWLIMETRLAPVWAVRYGVGLPVLLAAFAATFHPVFSRAPQFFFALALAAPAFSVIAMTAIGDAPATDWYYVGPVIVLMYGASMLPLRWTTLAGLSIATFLAYAAVALAIKPVAAEVAVTNLVFLGAAACLATLASHAVERELRSAWARAARIEAERARADELRLAAENANRAKDDFLAVISHELRTPLNAVIGFSDVIRNEMFGPLDSERYRAYASDINKSGRHLLGVIDEILELCGGAGAEARPLNEEPCDLDRLIEDALRRRGPGAAEAGVSLIAPERPSGLRLNCDRRMMLLALGNLISNAIKFTPEGGRVAVAVSAEAGEGLAITVADTGVGVAPGDLARLVEPFFQTADPRARETGGMGVGLTLVERVIARHDGEFMLESELGVGLTAIMRLPEGRLARAAGGERRHAPLRLVSTA